MGRTLSPEVSGRIKDVPNFDRLKVSIEYRKPFYGHKTMYVHSSHSNAKHGEKGTGQWLLSCFLMLNDDDVDDDRNLLTRGVKQLR